MRPIIRTLAVLIAGIAPAAHAASDAAIAFGARDAIEHISLSPNGSQIAIIEPTAGRGAVVRIGNLDTGDAGKVILSSSGDPDRLSRCDWITDTRLACQVFLISSDGVQRLNYTRQLVINSDGTGIKQISARTTDSSLGLMQVGGEILDFTADGKAGSILMTRDFVPEQTTARLTAQRQEGFGVEAIDAGSLARRIVESGKPGAVEYISDGHGAVRVMGIQSRSESGYREAVRHYLYRKTGEREWLPLGDLLIGGGSNSGFDPYAVDPDLNLVYGLEAKDGRAALYSVALDGTLKKQLVLANPQVDVDGLVQIGRQQRVVGATFATDRRQAEFFDPALRKLAAALGKALPAQPLITFVDASADESKLLLLAGADDDPGTYYLYDKATHKLGQIAKARPQLDGYKLASVKALSFVAADGTRIPAYLTLPPGSDGKNLPAIVMPHGGPSARDEWGFDWLSQFSASQGFAVLQPNFRGSAGYGADWFQKNGFQSWKIAIGDVNDGGRWLLSQGIAAPGKLAIVGWSYGGYAALQASVLDSDLFKAIIAIAPVTDLERLRSESRDFTNYKLVDAFIGHGPHVVEGSPAQNVEKITAPVLMFHGSLDTNVAIGESRLMEGRLKAAGKKVELVEFPGLDHQLDDAGARALLLDRSDAFLRSAMGIK